MSERINIAERAKSLIKLLRDEGINGVKFTDIYVTCEEEWGEDYALLGNVYADTWDMGEYFDEPRFTHDWHKAVRDHFDNDPTITFGFECGGDELEIHRKRAAP